MKEIKGYKFKKPIKGFNIIFKLEPNTEDLAIFSI